MTSGIQPPGSGAPQPVQGVTGGPAVLGGQISNDPSTGNVVIQPNPGQVLQIRKGNNPTALQVYEYFHTNTDFARIALNSQTGGPFQLAVETAPSTVIRGLQINANGPVTIPNLQVPGPRVAVQGVTSSPTTTSTSMVNMPDMTITFTLAQPTNVLALFTGALQLSVAGNQVATQFLMDGVAAGINVYQAGTPPNNTQPITNLWMFPTLAAGSHTLVVQWDCQSGTLTAVSTLRYLAVFG